MRKRIQFTLNGQPVVLDTDDGRSLLWVLRTDLGLTGTKYGCGVDRCGACTVLVGERPVRSCTTPLSAVAGRPVMTIEGLSRGGRLHPLQQAFIDQGALQCGYCTSGQLMAAYALLRSQPRPTRAQIVAAMEPHLCRCGAQLRVVAAVESAAQTMEGRP